MNNHYPIIEIGDHEPDMPEQQGNKTKYWLQRDRTRFLLKIGRPNTGENWAEKVACELAELLGLPHAYYNFAAWKQQKGVLTETIVPKDGRLVMGNELLSKAYNTYPTDQRYKVRDHTLGRIIALLSDQAIFLPLDWIPPDNKIRNALDVFLGYLLLDTWLANQDRHHENWGVINYNQRIYLAPTYDHAASMGQNEPDNKRKELLTTRDKGRHISHYIKKAHSAIYLNKSADKPLSTLGVYQRLAIKRPEAATVWQHQLEAVSDTQCQNIFARIPPSEISETAIEFALALLKLNKTRLQAML
ncbi:MAG: phosphatidylinositol kinase [Methylovulum sp.]|nr:MAG: phosphatidylinositol kinase [Methylovulum sp.]